MNEGGLNMKEQSELLEKCGFFNNFRGNSEVIKKGWIRLYCEDKEKSETCERKKSVKKQVKK